MASKSNVILRTTCKKCSKRFDDPRLLPCLHTFCKKCIESFVKEDGSKKTILCPICYSVVTLPTHGIDSFTQNMRLRYEAKVASYESRIRETPPENCDTCTRSPSPVVAFCCTCLEFMCDSCYQYHLVYKKTVTHKLLVMEEVKNKDITGEIAKYIPPTPMYCINHERKVAEFRCYTCKMMLCMQCTVSKHATHQFEEIRSLVEQEKSDLKEGAKILPAASGKLEETISAGKAMLQKIEVRKRIIDETVRTTFKELYENLQRREQMLLTRSSSIAASKQAAVTVQMEEMTALKEEIAYCNSVITESQEHTENQFLTVLPVLQARLEHLSKRFSHLPLKLREDDDVTLTLDPAPILDVVATFGVVSNFPPSIRDFRSLSEPVMVISVNAPRYIAIHENGDIYTTSYDDKQVYVFDETGSPKGTIGNHEDESGEFTEGLQGIAISGNTLIIAETNSNEAHKMTTEGELQWLGKVGPDKLYHPWGVCMGIDGNLYIAEPEKNRVKVFNPNSSEISVAAILDGNRPGEGSFLSPRDVAVDPSRNVHVAAYGSKCIKVFAQDGKFVREYGNSQLQGPYGIAVDQSGHSFVTDWDGTLWVFESTGELVHSLMVSNGLCGVATDKEGFVYVVSYNNGCVYKY